MPIIHSPSLLTSEPSVALGLLGVLAEGALAAGLEAAWLEPETA